MMMKRRTFLLTSGVAISLLNAKGNPDPAKGFVLRAQQSRFGEKTLLYGKSPNDIKVSGKDTSGEFAVFEYNSSNQGGPPLHLHHDQDEIFFILEGQYRFRVADEEFILKAGDTIFLPRNVPHTFAQITTTGKTIFVVRPSGKMEDYFRVLSKLTGPPSPEQLAKIFSDHGMKVVGPPL